MSEHLRQFDQTVAKTLGSPDPTVTTAQWRLHDGKPSDLDIEMAIRLWRRKQLNLETPQVRAATPERAGQLAQELSQRAMLAKERQNKVSGSDISNLGTTWAVEELVRQNEFKLERGSPEWSQLERLVERADRDLARVLLGELQGDPAEYFDPKFSPDQYSADEVRQREQGAKTRAPVRISGLLDRHMIEHKIAPSTEKSWRRHLLKLSTFLGHDDAHAITAEDLIRWKDHLLTEVDANGKRRSLKTVRESYLAAVKAVFAHAKRNKIITTNPAAEVTIGKIKQQRFRNPGFSDEEALTILRATLQPSPRRMTPEMALARRWVPWLCAYTGARVGEISQLRGKDVQYKDGHWIVHITPEAGSVKNNEARDVPLHHHLLEQGFLHVAEGRTEPLFYKQERHRGGKAGNPQYKKVGERIAAWVREIGVNDPKVQPNHGWRHRFKTLSRRRGVMHPDTADAIQGHAPATDGQGYGDRADISVMAEAINSLPRYEI